MWAIITNNNQIVAKDFKSKPAALGYMKFASIYQLSPNTSSINEC